MGVIEYNIALTGDCTNSGLGAMELSISGGTPNYTVTWLTPAYSPDILAASGVTKNNLSYGSYTFYITDQSIPINTSEYINFFISTGCCISIETQDSTCSLANGQITATTAFNLGNIDMYLYKDGVYISSASTFNTEAIFSNLSAGTYQILATDVGGCGCSSQTCLIRNNSSAFDYGLLVVSASTCTSNLGKLIVTGNTGTPPFIYNWSSNVPNASLTASTVTGLSAGSYSVIITDSTGCQVTKGATVGYVPNFGLTYYTATQASCLSDDGTVTFYLSGGTPPYYYILSNGDSAISYNQSYTFSGLAANTYSIQAVDLALCTFTQPFQIPMDGNFNVIGVSTTGVTCTSNGILSVNLIGNPPFTYNLTNSYSESQTIVTQVSNYQFTNLTADTYTLVVSDYLGTCEYTDTYVISGLTNFSISTTSTDTTCMSDNGEIVVTVTPNNSTTFTYDLQGIENSGPINDTTYTFSGLTTGIYTLTVTDESGCTQSQSITLINESMVNFNLYATSCGLGSQGTVSAVITDGTPPFTFNWTGDSVGYQTGVYLTGLTAGSYVLQLIDSNGCELTKSITVSCGNLISASYQVFNICESEFLEVPNQKRGLTQMLNEGYQDLINGDICQLNYANFNTVITVGSNVYTETFFTTTSLGNVPTDDLWIASIENLLGSAYGIGSLSINSSQNIVLILSDCNLSYDILQDQNIKIDLQIQYDISCQ
jgi:hypothetical protein